LILAAQAASVPASAACRDIFKLLFRFAKNVAGKLPATAG